MVFEKRRNFFAPVLETLKLFIKAQLQGSGYCQTAKGKKKPYTLSCDTSLEFNGLTDLDHMPIWGKLFKSANNVLKRIKGI